MIGLKIFTGDSKEEKSAQQDLDFHDSYDSIIMTNDEILQFLS